MFVFSFTFLYLYLSFVVHWNQHKCQLEWFAEKHFSKVATLLIFHVHTLLSLLARCHIGFESDLIVKITAKPYKIGKPEPYIAQYFFA